MRKFLICAAFLAAALRGFAQDAELTNYKSGIDAVWSGVKGTDYAEEYFYSDKVVTDRKVVYIRDTTSITLAHNARNIASIAGAWTTIGVNGKDGVANSGDEGVIRFRFDRDLNYASNWATNPAYTAPFTLGSLSYETAVPLVGTTGPKPGVAISDYVNYYTRGVLDSVGDEWHVMQVADDSRAFAAYAGTSKSDIEFQCDDGKLIDFVVNPKTPCLTIRATGNAQFYTTPPKHYFVPHIFDQTTYFSVGTGTVTFELHDLYGSDSYYRINGGSWSHGSDVTLSDTDFSTGSNTLTYYDAGNPTYVKTRTIIKNPGYASAGEVHGNFLWDDATTWTALLAKFLTADYSGYYNFVKTSNTWNQLNNFATVYHIGRRNVMNNCFDQAIVGKKTGYTGTCAQNSLTWGYLTKGSLLENAALIDPVGYEINPSNHLCPTRERYYRGYYDEIPTVNFILTYDLAIANIKAPVNGGTVQFTGGITEIEDLLIRDCIASFCFEGMMNCGHYQSHDYPVMGMWDGSRTVAAQLGAMILSGYSSPYYGTSGFDGNTTGYAWTPYPNHPITWKKAFLDSDGVKYGYPDQAEDLYHTIEGDLIRATPPLWSDRIAYFQDGLAGHALQEAARFARKYGVTYPLLEAAFVSASVGTLTGIKDTPLVATRYSTFGLYHSGWSTVSANSAAWMITRPSTSAESVGKNELRWNGLGLGIYDSLYRGDSSDTTPPTPNPMTFAVNPIALDVTAIQFTASTAIDAASSPVTYKCTVSLHSGGAVVFDSPAQSLPLFTVVGLLSATQYDVTVQAIDAVGNITTASAQQTITTGSPDTKTHIDPRYMGFRQHR